MPHLHRMAIAIALSAVLGLVSGVLVTSADGGSGGPGTRDICRSNPGILEWWHCYPDYVSPAERAERVSYDARRHVRRGSYCIPNLYAVLTPCSDPVPFSVTPTSSSAPTAGHSAEEEALIRYWMVNPDAAPHGDDNVYDW